MLNIERALAEDHLILTQITFDSKAYWSFTVLQLEEWKELLTITAVNINDNYFYKLVLNSEIIGYYSYLIISEIEIKLDNLFLLQQYIGKGYGKIMMEDFLSKAKLLKPQSITLEAEPNAEEFYKKFGFVTFDQKQSVIKDRFLPKMRLNL